MAVTPPNRSAKPSPEAMRKHACDAARLMKAVGNENRLMVLCALAAGELSVSELLERVDLSQSALSQHLAVLRREGIVSTRRESQSIYYSLSSSTAGRLIEFLYSTYCSNPAPRGGARRT
jgi:DNA-binding transcriptional ArsR family regulator